MKKKIILIIILLAIAVVLAFLLFSKNGNNKRQNTACFKSRCFNVEIASLPEERSRGLMFRKNLDPNSGMLFIFQEQGEHPFWMKNTLIPLDIIWINQNKEVVFISENAEPCETENCPSIYPDKKARYVLELNSGKATEIGLNVGDKVIFNLGFFSL